MTHTLNSPTSNIQGLKTVRNMNQSMSNLVGGQVNGNTNGGVTRRHHQVGLTSSVNFDSATKHIIGNDFSNTIQFNKGRILGGRNGATDEHHINIIRANNHTTIQPSTDNIMNDLFHVKSPINNVNKSAQKDP